MRNSSLVSLSFASIVFVMVFGILHAGFLESFCAANCNRGRGGNLCRCNGFHFAGKRTMQDEFVKPKENMFSFDKDDLNTIQKLDLSSLENAVKGDRYVASSNRIHRIEQAKEFLGWLLNRLKHSQKNTDQYTTYRDVDTDGLTD